MDKKKAPREEEQGKAVIVLTSGQTVEIVIKEFNFDEFFAEFSDNLIRELNNPRFFENIPTLTQRSQKIAMAGMS